MRKIWYIAVLLSALGLARPAWAQRNFFGAADPTNLNYVPLNTSRNLAAPVQAVPSQPFSLANFFAPLHLPNFLVGPRYTTSHLPPPSSFPSTHYKSPLYPVAPILQSQ